MMGLDNPETKLAQRDLANFFFLPLISWIVSSCFPDHKTIFNNIFVIYLMQSTI